MIVRSRRRSNVSTNIFLTSGNQIIFCPHGGKGSDSPLLRANERRYGAEILTQNYRKVWPLQFFVNIQNFCTNFEKQSKNYKKNNQKNNKLKFYTKWSKFLPKFEKCIQFLRNNQKDWENCKRCHDVLEFTVTMDK